MESAPLRPPERIDAGPVILWRVRQQDAPAIAEAVAASMKHLEPWLPWATPAAADPASQRTRITEADAMWEAGTSFDFSVLPADVAAGVLGGIGLRRRIGPGGLEIGYWIHAGHAGHGFATAAAGALTTVALTLPDVERVEIHCDVANAASAAIPRKLRYALDRIEDHEPEAPGESGRRMIWVLRPG